MTEDEDLMPWEMAAEEQPPQESMDATFSRQIAQDMHPADAAALDQGKPALSKSEQTARDLGLFDFKGAGETILAAGSAMANESARGLAGIAGTVGGLWPGGESPNEKGNRYMEAVPDFTYEPRTEGGQLGMEMLQKGGEAVLRGAKYPAAGVAGIAGGLGGAMNGGNFRDSMIDAVGEFMDTPNAMAEGVFRETQNPTLATITQILPELAASYTPLSRQALPKRRPTYNPREMDVPDGYGGMGMPDMPEPPSRQAFDDARKALANGDKERLLEIVNANPVIVDAFEQMGIEFTPGMVSESAALRQLEGGMASKADTGITQAQDSVSLRLQEKSRQLMDDAGGNADSPGVLDDKVSVEFERLRKEYMDEETVVWDRLDRQVPRGAEIDMRSAASELEDTALRLGKGDMERGLGEMSKHERELFNKTHRRSVDKETGEVTYEYDPPVWESIDRYRRRLGMGLNKSGPFNDAETGALNYWYGKMAEQQTRFAKGNNYEADWQRMNDLTKGRKSLEDNWSSISGQKMDKSAVGRVRTATAALLRGEVQAWDRLMNELPVSVRPAAAAESLRTIMYTARRNTKMSDSFVANFEKIKADPRLQGRIFRDIPEAEEQFMALGEAASGFYRAMKDVNLSKTTNAREAIKAIENGTLVGNVLRGIQDQTTGRLPVGGWIESLFRNKPDQRTAAAGARVEAAADVLTDSSFREAIIRYSRGDIEGAKEALNRAKGRLDLIMDSDMRARLQSMGIVALFEEEEEE